ncbi:MAG TPA: RNA polymerase sigma factor RpoD/SigA [bacterium]|nr:RNA polymerase sigma factor RpoD/SigA [bacterium]
MNKMPGRANRVLQKYLEEINTEDLLAPSEEIQLAKLAKEGDREALNTLVRSNLRFVVSVAKKYQNRGLTLEDLISEGNVGLIRAAFRFDETRGFKFISYAVWWIQQAILEAISQKSRTVRLPMNRVSEIIKVRKTSEELHRKFGREPSDEEIAEAMDTERDAIAKARKVARREKSMDEPHGDENMTLLNVLPSNETNEPDSIFDDPSLRYEIERALKTLSPKEADIIRLYYGIGEEYPQTLGKIGQKYNLTRERIRQIKAEGLKKLQNPTILKRLRQYLTHHSD